MRLVFFGTAGYHPSEEQQTACLMLPEVGIVLDAGTGFFRVRERLQTPALDILLTHAHLDHVVGLTYLLSTAWQRRLDRITVHGEGAKLATIREHLLAGDLFPAPLPCGWQPLSVGTMHLGGGRVTHFQLDHPGGTVGYRLDWPGRSLAYVTDTTAAAGSSYIDAIRGASLLVHECNFRDDQHDWAVKTGHSTPSAVAQVAAAAGVGRLILVHFNPLDSEGPEACAAAASRIFPGSEAAYDCLEVEF